jgi:YfiH family protein
MIKKYINKVPFYFFESLSGESGLLHFITTREGGVSEGSHHSFNLSKRVNDNPTNVKKNREILAGCFNIPSHNLILTSQTHEDKVAVIDKQLLEKPEEERDDLLFGVDAMVTNLKGVCLCILTADCASVILYDTYNKAVGVAHAGWKGTVKKIAAKTFHSMAVNYGSKPENIIAAIGPCISGDSFEVGEEVALEFYNVFGNNPDIVLRKPEWPKPHVDIVKANAQVLTDVGIKIENIEFSNVCTYQNPDIFFSARRKADGRFGAGVMLV